MSSGRDDARLLDAAAGGKVILLGEHAVVYGAPALVGGLEAELQARLWRLPDGGPSRLELGAQQVEAGAEGSTAAARAWDALLRAGPTPGPVHAAVHGSLPVGVGLGSSACAGVALARAVERALGEGADERRVQGRAMAWERVFHGNPSGADVAAAMRGGLLRFVRPAEIRSVPAPVLVLSVGLTGERSATHDMVGRVAALRQRDEPRVQGLIDEIAALVDEGIDSLGDGDTTRLGGLMDRNQELLEGLEVSTQRIERMTALGRRAGALGAKLTGSGGGGAVIAFAGGAAAGAPSASLREANERAEAVVQAWRSAGFAGFVTRIGEARDRSAAESPA